MAKLNKEDSFEKILMAEKSLGNRRDVKLYNNRVYILNGKDKKAPRQNDLGIKAWGMVDALINFGGYNKIVVDNFKDIH